MGTFPRVFSTTNLPFVYCSYYSQQFLSFSCRILRFRFVPLLYLGIFLVLILPDIDAPFVLHWLSSLCTRNLYYLLLRPLAGEISTRYGTVTFNFSVNGFDHQGKTIWLQFEVFRGQGAVVCLRPCGGERNPLLITGLSMRLGVVVELWLLEPWW